MFPFQCHPIKVKVTAAESQNIVTLYVKCNTFMIVDDGACLLIVYSSVFKYTLLCHSFVCILRMHGCGKSY